MKPAIIRPMNISNSASKIVFILIATGTIGLTFMKIMDVKDFVMIAGMVFSFYFSNKGEPSAPFAGK